MVVKSPLPNQTKDIYSLLLKKGPLSAEQIGKELNIFPHAVYRSVGQLKSLGCINQVGNRPALFEAQPVSESVEVFSLLQREWFLKAFLTSQKSKQGSALDELQISFIESREDMFDKFLPDFDTVEEELDLLISGDEIPAEVMFAQKKLIEKGVLIRSHFQNKTKKNESFLQARKRMGEEVRVYKPLNTRIMIFDKKIAYIMSYDPHNYIKSTGIRFEYPPLAQLMHGLFMQYWEKGKEL